MENNSFFSSSSQERLNVSVSESLHGTSRNDIAKRKRKTYSEEEKEFIKENLLKNDYSNKKTLTSFKEHYGYDIPHSVVSKIKKRIMDGEPLHSKRGRPPIIPEIIQDKVMERIEELRENSCPVTHDTTLYAPY